jgi:predicted nucleotidyltransferase/predicted transcriptional regulator with HTH domain
MIVEALSLSNALFSKVQQRVLALIFGQPERSFYTSEIVRKVHSGPGAVERELSKLQRSGLVSVERIGNQKHYRANRESPIFSELQSLVTKTVGLAEPLRRALERYAKRITAAFIYGSVAKGSDTARSDIDLMVIGDDLTYSELFSALEQVESTLGRKINPTFLSPKEWQSKAKDKSSIVSKITPTPRIFVLGSEKDLPRQSRAAKPEGSGQQRNGGAMRVTPRARSGRAVRRQSANKGGRGQGSEGGGLGSPICAARVIERFTGDDMTDPALVLTTVNAPHSTRLTAQELAHCLLDHDAAKAVPGHMWSFFGDVQPELQQSFAAHFGISDAQLAAAVNAFAAHSGASYPLAA